MLHIQVDPHSGVPVYRQVVDQIKYYIASGALAEGAQLPSIRELAQRLSINPTTVVKAYNELQGEGAIEMVHGKGVFVTGRRPELSSADQQERLRRLARQLAVESRQMGWNASDVLKLLRSELERMNPDE